MPGTIIAGSRSCKRNLRTHEAAEFLGVSPQTLRNWRAQKKGPDYSRVGGAVVYPIEALEAYVEAGRVRPAGGRS